MLEGIQITKHYGKTAAIDHVDIAVAPASITLLLGPSGSGKSTLLRNLSLIETPDSGAVTLDGETIVRGGGDRHGSMPYPRVTLVFQQLFLWPHMTIRENILVPAMLRGLDTNPMNSICAALGLDDLLDRHPNQMSVGQRQRAAVARALLLRPDYLLLDEITSSLDVEHIGALMTVLLDHLRAGTGIALVTHHLGIARHLLAESDRGSCVFLDQGRIIESGGKELLVQPRTERVRSFMSVYTRIA